MPSLKTHHRTVFLLSFLLILSCVLAVYFNSLKAPFIWDDQALVLRNPLIRSVAHLKDIFVRDLYSGVSVNSNFYRPVQNLSYLWDYHFWELDPFGYHLTNILLQVLVSFLVLLLAYSLTGSFVVSLSAALLFAVCPLHTQAVTYISGRAEMLMALFLLSSLLSFFRSQSPKAKYAKVFFVLSLVLFAFALLSKELAVVFPLVVLSWIFYFSKDKIRRAGILFRRVSPFFALSVGYLSLRLSVLNFSASQPSPLSRFPLFVRITVLPKVLLSYFKLLILPVDLHMSRGVVRPTTFLGFCLAWFGLAATIAVCVYVLRNKAQRKTIPFLLAWFLIFILPQSGIFPINSFISEHFIYLSSISFFIGVSALLVRYLKRQVFFFSLACLVIYYGTLTVSRNFEWQDHEVFYKRVIRLSPGSYQAHNNLGMYYLNLGLYEKAVQEYKKALELMPGLLEAHSNLAEVYYRMGRYQDSLEEYTFVEKLVSPGKAGEIQNNIGAVFEAKGLYDEAIRRYERALKLDPRLHFAYFNMARIDLLKGDVSAVSPKILKSMPSLCRDIGDPKGYLKIIEQNLDSLKTNRCAPSFYNNLGIKFAEAQLYEGAIAAFKLILELDSGNADTHFNLGLAYLKMGDMKKAQAQFKQAVKLNPRHYKAIGLLAALKKGEIPGRASR
jgi:protein O-mannosyl-transferase